MEIFITSKSEAIKSIVLYEKTDKDEQRFDINYSYSQETDVFLILTDLYDEFIQCIIKNSGYGLNQDIKSFLKSGIISRIQ